jgi:mannose-6-phosphate isomerase-like protein (cupin superfamily)
VSEKVLIVDLDSNPEYQRLLGGKPQTWGMRSGKVYLEPGKDCGLHSTKEHEELLVFLSGNGKLIIAEKDTLEVGAGKVAYIPPRTGHNVMNTGSQPLVYIYCVTPVSSDV